VQDLWMLVSGDATTMQAQLRLLLEGYDDIAELDPRELRLIEPLRTLRMVRHSAWLAERWIDPAFPAAFAGGGGGASPCHAPRGEVSRLNPTSWRPLPSPAPMFPLARPRGQSPGHRPDPAALRVAPGASYPAGQGPAWPAAPAHTRGAGVATPDPAPVNCPGLYGDFHGQCHRLRHAPRLPLARP
jgi:hypothetical protein